MSQGGDKKVIKINPELFKFANNNTRKNKPDIKKEPKPIKIKSVNRDKTIKRDMLRRIRANQAEQYDKMFNSDKRGEPIIISPVEKFETEFNDTMDFMNKLVDKHKREKDAPKHNQTVRSNASSNASSNLIPNLIPNASSNVSSNLIPSVQTNASSNLIPSVQTNASSNVGPNLMPSIGMPLMAPLSTNVAPSIQSNLVPSIQSNLVPSIGMPVSTNVAPSVSTNVAPSVSSNLVPNIGMPLSTNVAPLSKHTVPPQPTYGCLKNGSLPTYRSAMNKTAKNITTSVKPQPASAIERIRARLNERANRQIDVKIPKAKPNKIIRRTYNVGKDKFRPVVGVLLPNRTIRNNVANKAFKFKHTPVEEIRKFLLRNGFIKVGSTSPNDVLYKMYESIMLIDGEVKNHNPDNLLYNFFNDKTP
jgi:hypothetical protein